MLYESCKELLAPIRAALSAAIGDEDCARRGLAAAVVVLTVTLLYIARRLETRLVRENTPSVERARPKKD